MSKTVLIPNLKPVPKPRQTRSDKWKVRPCVAAYRAFADELRLRFGPVPEGVKRVTATFYIKTPDSWSQKKRLAKLGTLHDQKPDLDNLLKATVDALLPEDKAVGYMKGIKYWAAENAIEVIVDA